MSDVSLLRLQVLRATYLLMVVGLGATIWPLIISHPVDVPHMNGVVRSLLGAVALLALLGLRYPLMLLPVLLFELVWKVIWVLAFGLPLWSAGLLDAGTRATLNECLMGLVVFPLAIPWRYVWAQYVRAPAEPFRRRG